MSRDDLSVLQAALDAHPEASLAPLGHDLSDAASRLLDALPGVASGATAWRDLASLIRQVLLITGESYGGDPSLVVPTGPGWPDSNQWRLVGCPILRLLDGRLQVRAEAWTPARNPDNTFEGLEQVAAIYREGTVGRVAPLPADPFWRLAHGYEQYRGEPQRQAARSAVLGGDAPLLIALPTGRGKTAVAWSRALLSESGVTVVIVPTVVLALDMERRTADEQSRSGRSLSPINRFAYVGALDSEAKKALRSAVRSGQQRLIYTSPEAFVSGLAKAVIDCAADGHLQQVVVDEVHLVDQWGSDFRPEFQTLPGLINEARRAAPTTAKPAVILMSATLSQRHVDVISRLFADEGRLDIVWGSALRPEPVYFIEDFRTEEERSDAVLDALSRLPKPAILYATKVADANEWVRRLRQSGFRRVSEVTGASSDESRRSVMQRWRGAPETTPRIPTSIDIVVGTSAFGLGLDMPNVRTVIHACLPETVDRFYQEVGRSGRDGRASVSYLATTPADRPVARNLSTVTLIGDKKGLTRWKSLLSGAEEVGPFRYRVRKSTLPPYMDAGYGESAAWNVRTLTLMAQAGIVRLMAPQWTRPAGMSDPEAERSEDDFYANFRDFLDFQISSGALTSDEGWLSAVSKARSQASTAQSTAFHYVEQIADRVACPGRVLARHFSISFGPGVLKTFPACRGCPVCRTYPESAPGIGGAEPVPRLQSKQRTPDPLSMWRGASPSLYVWRDPDARSDLPLLVRMAQRGLTVIAGLDEATAWRLQKSVPGTAIVADTDLANSTLLLDYEGPLVCVLPPHELPAVVQQRIGINLVTYLLGDRDTPDRHRDGWALRDTVTSVPASAVMKGL